MGAQNNNEGTQCGTRLPAGFRYRAGAGIPFNPGIYGLRT
jgi:hypothetical protein